MLEVRKNLFSIIMAFNRLYMFRNTLGGIGVLPQAEVKKVSGLDARRLNYLALGVA